MKWVNMFRRIDRSKILLKLTDQFTTVMAKRRGLPIVIGIFFVIIGFGLQIVDVYTEDNTIALLGVVMHSGGTLIALVGVVLANPLGQ